MRPKLTLEVGYMRIYLICRYMYIKNRMSKSFKTDSGCLVSGLTIACRFCVRKTDASLTSPSSYNACINMVCWKISNRLRVVLLTAFISCNLSTQVKSRMHLQTYTRVSVRTHSKTTRSGWLTRLVYRVIFDSRTAPRYLVRSQSK